MAETVLARGAAETVKTWGKGVKTIKKKGAKKKPKPMPKY